MDRRDTENLCQYVAHTHAVVRRFATATGVGRRFATGAILVFALVSFAPAASAHGRGCADAHSSIRRTPRRALQRAALCLINQQRRSRHLAALQGSSRLNRSAQGWTNVMVSHRYFGHGADFAARISAVGFHWSNAGENIATGYGTPAAVVRGWMASTGHCQNILSPIFREVGTGVARQAIIGSDGTWTQDFGLWMGQHPASGNWGPADGCPYR